MEGRKQPRYSYCTLCVLEPWRWARADGRRRAVVAAAVPAHGQGRRPPGGGQALGGWHRASAWLWGSPGRCSTTAADGGRTPCGGPGVPGPGSSTMNLGVLAQRAHQCFGHRAGWMSDDAGERVPADGVLGWAEDAVNRWSGGLWWGEKAQPARSSSTSPTSSPSAIPQGGQLSGVKPSVR